MPETPGPRSTILVPDSVLRQPREPRKIDHTKCPACKAKFSHDNQKMVCKKCGIPDEIVAMGHRMIARWKSKQGLAKSRRVATRNKKTNKPGRKGVKK